MDHGKFMSRQYQVPLTEIFLAVPNVPNRFKDWDNALRDYSSSSDSENDQNHEKSFDESTNDDSDVESDVSDMMFPQ